MHYMIPEIHRYEVAFPVELFGEVSIRMPKVMSVYSNIVTLVCKYSVFNIGFHVFNIINMLNTYYFR